MAGHSWQGTHGKALMAGALLFRSALPRAPLLTCAPTGILHTKR